jgi:succinate dehydrogenase/fumarate reductase cytochrome b subunit
MAERRRDRRVPWGAVAGTVVLAYVVVEAVALLSVDDRNRFNRWGAAMGSIGARLVLSGVLLAALFHTLDGLRRLVVGVAPSVERRDDQLRLAVVFLTWALAVPAAAVVIWPWWKATFA